MSEKQHSQMVPMVELDPKSRADNFNYDSYRNSQPSSSSHPPHNHQHLNRRNRIVDASGRETRPLPTMTTVTTSSSQRLAQHMTIAGSFLDLALFVADVEHLKYLLDAGKANVQYYNMLIICVCASMFLQIVVVILMFIVGFRQTESTTVRHHRDCEDYDDYPEQSRRKNRDTTVSENNGIRDQISISDPGYLNKVIIILVTFIAIINVFVTVFGNRSSADLIQKYRAGVNISQC